MTVPVDAGAAEPLAGIERAQIAHRERDLVRAVAEGQRLLGEILHELEPRVVAQLVVHPRRLEVGVRVPCAAPLEADHLEPRLGELLGEDPTGPADAGQHHVNGLHLDRHDSPPQC